VGYTPIAVSHQLRFWLKLGCDNSGHYILHQHVPGHPLAHAHRSYQLSIGVDISLQHKQTQGY
jgi:hypothetical protein